MATNNTTDQVSNSARLHEEIIQLYNENRDIVDNHVDYSEHWRAVFPDGMLLELCQEFECCPSLIFIALETFDGQHCPDIHSRKTVMCDINTHEQIKRFDSITDAALYIKEQGHPTASVQTIFHVVKKRNNNAYGYYWAFDEYALDVTIAKLQYYLVSCNGIYKIKNQITQQEYIGQTRQFFRSRWAEHIRKAQFNKNHTNPLYISMCQYGIDIFEFSIVEIMINPSKELLLKREQYWIDYFQTLSSDGGLNYVRPSWQRKADQYDVEAIYRYLDKGLSNVEINLLTGASEGLISRIRNGTSYRKENHQYPILSDFQQNQIQLYTEVIKLLQDTTMSLAEISRITGLHVGSVRKIYQGKYSELIKKYIGTDFVFQDRTKQCQTPKKISKITKRKNKVSQLPDRQCDICGEIFHPKNAKQKYCSVKCKNISIRKSNRPTRSELKYLIRNFAFTAIGKQFGVSDQAVRKWCIAEELPTSSTQIKRYTDEEWELEIWHDPSDSRFHEVQQKTDYQLLASSFLSCRNKQYLSIFYKNCNSPEYIIEKYDLRNLATISYTNTTCYLFNENLYFRSAEDAGKWLLAHTTTSQKTHCKYADSLSKQFRATSDSEHPTATVAGFTFTHISEEEFYEVIQHHHVVSYAHDPKWARLIEDPSILPDFVSLDDLPWVEEFKAFYNME